VLDAVVATVVEVGYYKASSNEIARHAGVTWGAIHHLFGSREQLMLEVFEDLGDQAQRYFGAARVDGSSLEERLRSLLDVLAYYYEQPRYFVEVQILLDFTSNPRVSEATRRDMRHRNAETFPRSVRPLLSRALGDGAPDDLCLYVFTSLQGYLTARVMLGLSVELADDTELRDLLALSVAAGVRAAAAARRLTIEIA
jgi:AcrR family transcriptional regulator